VSALAYANSEYRLRIPWARRLTCALIFCFCAFSQAASEDSVAISEPQIVPRAAWGAVAPNADLMQEQKPSEIVIHHTGEKQQPKISLETKMRGLQGFAMTAGRVGHLSKPAWGDVPYHYYIDVSGRIGEGRDIGFAGDGVTGMDNEDRIQIVVEGDFEREEPAKEELDSLMKLVQWLALKFAIAPENISGHSDHDQTDCPGKNLKPFLEDLRKAVRSQYAQGDR
jgi:hypothetical protein